MLSFSNIFANIAFALGLYNSISFDTLYHFFCAFLLLIEIFLLTLQSENGKAAAKR